MAWPNDELPLAVEMWTGSEWTDITSDVRAADGANIAIGRGQPDESSSPEPGSITATLANKTGKYSPRNPASVLYGKIGRNTPLRVSVGDELCGAQHMLIADTTGTDQATIPDDDTLHITGDIDIRIDAAMDTWNGAVLAGRYLTTGDQRSWAISVTSDGKLSLAWSALGTSASVLSATSTASAGLTDGSRKALRYTLDVVNGSVHTTKFYTADTIDGTWTQLGSSVNGSDGTSILAGTADLEVGQVAAFSTGAKKGKIYAFQLLDGIDGTAVANPDFREQVIKPDGSSDDFTDDAGLTWSLSGDTSLFDPGIRSVDEVSEWPPRWDVSGQDVTTSVTAQGVLRRLGQGALLRSALRRWYAVQGSSTKPIAYWPLEDPYLAPTAETPVPGALPGTVTPGRVEFGDSGPAGAAGAAHLVTGDPTVGSFYDNRPALLLKVPETDVTGELVWSLWFSGLPFVETAGADGSGDSSVTISSWMNFDTSTGTIGSIAVNLFETVPGTAARQSYVSAIPNTGLDRADTDLTEINTYPDGPQIFDLDWHQVQVRAYQSGSDVVTEVYLDGVMYDTATETSQTLGVPTEIKLATSGSVSNATAGTDTGRTVFDVSSVMVHNDLTVDASDLYDVGSAHVGETAGDRASRLCDEGGITFNIVGDADDTMPMGAMPAPTSFIDAYNETWAADQGLSFETRGEVGLSLRTRRNLYNQSIACTLDYDEDGEIAPDLEPTDDDQHVRNRITVSRKGGSSVTVEDSTSRMGTQDPPDGVGVYEDSVGLNLKDDTRLLDHAAWRVHIGTWDEARYPVVRINMTALAAAGKTDLIAAAASLDVGDRLRLTNLPVWTGADGGTVDLMCLGFTETFGYPNMWMVEINTVPYGPYFVFEVGDQVLGRLDTSGSALALGVDSDDTSLLVATDSGKAVWINSDDRPDDFPFAVTLGGETVKVTAIDGTTSPQTFTVVRSFNGVEKSHSAGADVRIARVAVS